MTRYRITMEHAATRFIRRRRKEVYEVAKVFAPETSYLWLIFDERDAKALTEAQTQARSSGFMRLDPLAGPHFISPHGRILIISIYTIERYEIVPVDDEVPNPVRVLKTP